MSYFNLDMTEKSPDRQWIKTDLVDAYHRGDQEDILRLFNLMPGLEYRFDGLKLKWRLSDESAYRAALKSMHIQSEAIDTQICNINANDIAINYEFLHQRVKDIYVSLHGFIPKGSASSRAALTLKFGQIFSAGAIALADGSDAISVGSGLSNLPRWFAVRSLLDNSLPFLSAQAQPGQYTLTPDDIAMASCLSDLTQSYADRIVSGMPNPGVPAVSVGQIGSLHMSVEPLIQHILQNPEQRSFARLDGQLQTLDRPIARCNWSFALTFVLAHEIGHINLGHLDEVKEFRKNPVKSKEERERRQARLRTMELDADSYGFGCLAILMERNFGRAKTLDVEFQWRNIICPVVDFFTMIELATRGQRVVPVGPHPSGRDRLQHLLSKGNSAQKIERIVAEMDVVLQLPRRD
jgi:hypothetical protein